MAFTEDIIETLRMKGFRITPQREMVLEVLSGSERHMTAEEVYRAARKRVSRLNLATVYRTLELLVENCLASRSDLGGGRVVYAPVFLGTLIFRGRELLFTGLNPCFP